MHQQVHLDLDLVTGGAAASRVMCAGCFAGLGVVCLPRPDVAALVWLLLLTLLPAKRLTESLLVKSCPVLGASVLIRFLSCCVSNILVLMAPTTDSFFRLGLGFVELASSESGSCSVDCFCFFVQFVEARPCNFFPPVGVWSRLGPVSVPDSCCCLDDFPLL